MKELGGEGHHHLLCYWSQNMDKSIRRMVVPRVCIIGGKAPPGYEIAKKIIKLCHAIAEKINKDADVGDLLKLVFTPDYNVSIAELLIPGSGLSQHISTAGHEASGTSNMKFLMNGYLLLAIADGSTVEIIEEIGEDVMVMKDGRITQAGKYDKILSSGTDFMELVGSHRKALSALDFVETESASKNSRNGEVDKKDEHKEENEKEGEPSKTDEIVGPKAQIVQKEEREKGRVGLQVYWKFITMAYKGSLVPLILLAHILFQILQIRSNYWIALATPVSADVEAPVKGTTLIFVYVALAIGSSFSVLVRAALLVTAGYKTSTLLFQKMHYCIFRAPMSFFIVTPSERILNRVSIDQSAVDLNISFQISGLASSVIQLLGIIAVMSQVAWQVFIIFIPVISACIWYQQYYLPPARELVRLTGVCKAPVI